MVANEAKDNVKYLSTLDKFFGPLGKCTPVKIKLSVSVFSLRALKEQKIEINEGTRAVYTQ